MGRVSQTMVAKFLRAAQTDREVEEILGAYVHAKQLGASHPAQVERKLSLLACYLNAIGQREQLSQHSQTFSTMSSIASSSIPASNLVFPSTRLGSEIWDVATKETKSWFRSSRSSGVDSSSSSLSQVSFSR
ncbi:hypothetical protein JCM3766R1_004589 [Sporobolomyces carnicolor]